MSELLLSNLIGGMGEEKGIQYFPIYDRHFRRFKDLSPLIIEIGVNNGGSLKLWKSYFGGNSRIVGVDINPNCIHHAADAIGINVAIGDATDPEFLDKLIKQVGQPDIIIDDGSHKSEDIQKTFECLYPTLYRNGVYLVEDLHMAYFEGQAVPNSFIEYSKGLMDDMNSSFRNVDSKKWFSKTTMSMTVYESIIVFERGVPLLPNKLADQFMAFSKDGSKITLTDRKVPSAEAQSTENAPPAPGTLP